MPRVLQLMNAETAVAIVEQILSPRSLSYVQRLVFSHSWEGKTYREIASTTGYDSDYVKEVGSQLWGLLSESLGERVNKKNIPLLLQQYVSKTSSVNASQPRVEPVVIPFSKARMPLSSGGVLPGIGDPESGRVTASAELQTSAALQIREWLPEGLPGRRHLNVFLEDYWQMLARDTLTLSDMGLPLASLSLMLLTLEATLPGNFGSGQVGQLKPVFAKWQRLFNRPGDCLGRYDAATLGIALGQTHPKGALHLAEQMRQAFQELRFQSLKLAIGVATIIPRRSKQLETLLQTAEAALLEARHKGRDYILYRPCLD